MVTSVYIVQIPINPRCGFNVEDDENRKIIFLTLSIDESLRVGNLINHEISVSKKERILYSRLRPSVLLYHISFDLVELTRIFIDQPLSCFHFHTLVLPRIRHSHCHRESFHNND